MSQCIDQFDEAYSKLLWQLYNKRSSILAVKCHGPLSPGILCLLTTAVIGSGSVQLKNKEMCIGIVQPAFYKTLFIQLFYVFWSVISGLFNSVVGSSEYTVLNGRMTSE
jgi:hypothetical protein